MPNLALRSACLTIAVAVAAGCSRGEPGAVPQAEAAQPGPRGAGLLNVALLDPKASACTDFNAFVNAKWIAANPIPPDRTRWGAFDELREKSLDDQRTIAEKAAQSANSSAPGSIERKIGDLYRAGMDEAAIEAAGYDPVKPTLAAIAALKTPAELADWLMKAFAAGDEQVFSFGSDADYKDAAVQIAYAYQGGLGLPTPDYYSKDEYKDLRAAYAAHIAKLFELTGAAPDVARRHAENVLAVETTLAAVSLPPVELRKPENQYHFVSVDEADALMPHFDWKAFFAAQGIDPGKGFSLSQPKFFAGLDKMLVSTPLEQWKDYLSFHVIDDAAPYLSKAFEQEDFDFNGKTLNGQPELEPRWKRVLRGVNRSMGQALGQLYVADYFPPEAKARAEELVVNVRNALKARIEDLDWMSDATKQKALAKWEKFLPKIGYPAKWRDWSGLTISAESYYAEVMAARKFNYEYDIGKIGKPTDRLEWGMTPQTVNAYYNPTDNTINFPAAILQPPFFYANGDDALNYGGIGAVIGHESSHGFDDEGSQFDGDGNNVNWWTKEDRDKFDARTDKLVAQFDAYAPLPDRPDKHVDGRLTLGENIADLAGLNVAYDALQTALKQHPDEAARKIDGYTEDQRFFLNWARVWRANIREKRELVLLNADPHAPSKFRAIGAPSNMPAFAAAFGCGAGDAMVRAEDQRVRIW